MRQFFICLCLTMFCSSGYSAVITFDATHLGGTQWRNNYSVTGTSGDNLRELTIYFALNLYANLQSASAPGNWSAIAIQPDAALSSHGYYDALSLAGPAPDNTPLHGFSVTFDFLGGGAPGVQSFDIVSPDTFAVTGSGHTVPALAVPEPASLQLWLAGLVMLAAGLGRRRL